jgi:methionine sulfoxide reductase heme-binding subunit
VIHVGALLPLAVLLWDYAHDDLTVNPIQRITLWTGKWTLVLLVLSLACTPASSLLGFRAAIRWRRPLGVYAFFYAVLHFLTFVGLDYTFDVGLLREAIFEKRYALVGFSAFILLLPLAITSTTGWMRRLGRRWKRLHQLVYVAAVLAVLHFTWSVKADIRVPLQYAGLVSLLLIARLPPVRRAARRLIQRRPAEQPPARSKTRAGEPLDGST